MDSVIKISGKQHAVAYFQKNFGGRDPKFLIKI